MNPDSEHLARLIIEFSESLHCEIALARNSLRKQTRRETRRVVNVCLDHPDARWTARVTTQYRDLERRLRNLERKKNGHK